MYKLWWQKKISHQHQHMVHIGVGRQTPWQGLGAAHCLYIVGTKNKQRMVIGGCCIKKGLRKNV
jgi:hypothetical protein